jgi:hypothetical protein
LPHRLGVPPPPQMYGALHVPQSSRPPQPSPTAPQFAPTSVQLRGVHAAPLSPTYGLPQTLGTPPPPQMYGALHAPQSSKPPQPSPTGPQFAPTSAHVRGVHARPLSPT